MSTIAQPDNNNANNANTKRIRREGGEGEPPLLFPPVQWSFYSSPAEKDESSAAPASHSRDGLVWTDIAHSELIDNTLLQVSNEQGYRLWLYLPSPDGEMLRIEPPEPVPFFGFTRLSQSIGFSDTRWLYSCFGYVLPDFLHVTKIFPGQPTRILESRLLPRPCVFPL